MLSINNEQKRIEAFTISHLDSLLLEQGGQFAQATVVHLQAREREVGRYNLKHNHLMSLFLLCKFLHLQILHT